MSLKRITWLCLAFCVSALTASCGGGGAAPVTPAAPEPTLLSIDIPSGKQNGGTLLTLVGTSFADPAFVEIDGAPATTVVVMSETSITCRTPAGTPGVARDIVVTVPDGIATLVSAFTYLAAPTVLDVVPGGGPMVGGTVITITGTGFSVGVQSVTVAAAPATAINVVSDTGLTCATPAGAGVASVAVHTLGGTGAKGSAFTYDSTVILTGATPGTGFAPGGTWLTLSGSGFTSGAAGSNTVTVGGVAATGTVAVNDTTITCISPAGSVGAKQEVRVTNGNGTAALASQFEYFGYPPNFTTPNTRIDAGTAGLVNSALPQLCCSGTSVYALWVEGPGVSSDVTFSRSTDGGASWSSPVKLNTNAAGASASAGASICCEGQNVYVVFRDDRNNSGPNEKGDMYFQKSSNGGSTWLASDVRLNTTTAGAWATGYARICVDGSNLVVAWADERPSTGGYEEVRIQRSSNGGATWLTNDVGVRDSGVGGNVAMLELASCGTNVYLTWADSRNDASNRDIYFTGSTNSGATWLTSNVRLNTDAAGTSAQQLPKLSCEGSSVHVVWRDDRNGKSDVQYQRSTNNGASWLTNDVKINTNAGGASRSISSQICCDQAHVYIVWTDDRNAGSRHDVYFRRSTDRGASFASPDVRISTDAAGNALKLLPFLACENGHVFAAWSDRRNSVRNDIYFTCSRDAGATWLSTDVRLNDDTAGDYGQTTPTICCDGARAVVAWEDHRANSVTGDIYLVSTKP